MKKIYNKIVSVIVLLLTIFATGQEAMAYSNWPSDLYLVQATDVTCTLCSNAMMLRARLHLAGREYQGLTEWALRPYGWIEGAGQRASYSYNYNGATFTINQAYVNGLTVASLQQILNSHPEGVCIYVTSIPHAQWVSDIVDGVVYAGDSSCQYYSGRKPLWNTYQGQCCGYSQEAVLANVTSYWYVSSTNLSITAQEQTITAPRSIPDGKYRIACYSNINYGLNVAGGSDANEANVHIWEYVEGAEESQFQLTWNGEFYHIKACHSNKNLDLYQAKSVKGTNVQQYEVDGTNVQKWTLKDAGGGVFNIINYNGLYMDVANGNVANGTNVQGWEGNNSDAQKWVFIPVDKEQELPDGDYRIAAAGDINFTLDVSGGSVENGANIQIYKAWEPGSDDAQAQVWSVTHIGNGYYKVISKKSGKALNVKGNAISGGPNVQLWDYVNGDAASTWILKETGDGSFYVYCKNGRALDVNNGTLANGTNVQGWYPNGSVAQKWRFIAVDGGQTIPDGVYNIRSAADQRFGVDVAGVSNDNSANVHLWTIGEGYNQKFKVKYLNNGYYSLISLHSKKALDVEEARSDRGANVQQYEDNGSAAQQWIIREIGDGVYNIINRNGLFLDIFGGTMKTGTNIQGWYGNGSPAQKWVFTETFYDDQKPVISDIQVTDVTSAGYRVTCTVSDNVAVTNVKMPSWSIKDGQDDLKWLNATITGNKASCYVKTAEHNNETGEYLTHIYVYDKAGNETGTSAGTIVVPDNVSDSESPRIWDPVISELSPEGFRVTCRISDDTYVKSVKMATWTERDDQDDLNWHEATITTSGKFATVYVKTEDHKKECGDYIVHIYAWDQADNRSSLSAGKINVPVTSRVFRVACAANEEFGLDIDGAKTDNHTNVQIWHYEGGANQMFRFEHKGNGIYQIFDCKSGKALDVTDVNPEKGANIQIYGKGDNNPAQLWKAISNPDGTYTFVSVLGTTMDVHGGIIENGRNVQTWEDNNTIAQRWKLIPVEYVETPSGNGYQTYQGGRGGSGNVVAMGIDVSEHQGAGFDFAGMKARGVNFVILRCGWVGRKDYRFDEYYNAARAAGLDIGAYFYSYAENASEALNEANVCLSQIAGKTFEYPIYFDFEDNTYQGHLNSVQSRDVCLTFLDRVASQGYLVGLYGMASWIDEDWGGKVPTATVCQKYECWIANYASNVEGYKNIYKTRYGMYQYSDGGTTAPTAGFGVDSNYCFKDYPAIVKQHHFNGY